jgi:hypothetical protein
MSASARLSLPFLSPGQAQKEVYHNEALQALDLLTAAAVEEEPRNDPPACPTPGTCYIVGSSPTDAWVGKSRCIAGYTSGGWKFVTPIEGMSAFIKSSSIFANYRVGAWEFGTLRGNRLLLAGQQVVGSRLGAIDDPNGGTTVDSEGRAAIDQILAALRQHGLIES